MRPFFKFKDKKSTDLGLGIVQLPDRIKPEEIINTIEIPGRSGSLHTETQTYKSYTISIVCYLNFLAKTPKNIDNIIHWLNGSGELIISQEIDKIYDARIVNTIPFSNILGVFPEFLVNFEVQPFKRSKNSKNDIITINKKTIINNKGNIYSLPKITIWGSGNVDLLVNNQVFRINNIDEYVTIDSKYQEVYKGNLNKNNTYNSFSFPIFQIGKNEISFIGNVRKLEIEPNWAWI